MTNQTNEVARARTALAIVAENRREFMSRTEVEFAERYPEPVASQMEAFDAEKSYITKLALFTDRLHAVLY